MLRFSILPLAIAFIAACGPSVPESQATNEPSEPPTLSVTRTPTSTPTQTPTPTATAPAAVVSGNPRALNLSDPVRQSGAPCGFVDTLDFPLDPPDAARARGGSDYGRFRSRYDGYHTGEDWRVGASSFGQPVYSIGHGQVTYAQPNGWGADKGVVIVQHTFRNLRRTLSFYGHLDPPSIDVRAGHCVERGDQVGRIGDPRSSPHLHFEIRLHLPDTPGPGYWSVDPNRSGWRPPSATIWNERMAQLPIVRWTRLSDATSLTLLGLINDDLLTFSSAGELLAIAMDTGRTQWSRLLPETALDAVLDDEGELIYVLRGAGIIEAFRVSDVSSTDSDTQIQPQWSIKLGAGSLDLAPFPGGGFVASSRSGTTAVSDAGREMWHEERITGIVDWAEAAQSLFLLARDGVWLADEDRISRWTNAISGEKVIASDHPYVYTEDGIYSLDLEARSTQLIFDLASGFPRSGDLAEIPQGGILLVHLDLDDKRLIAIDSDGSMRWERSIADLGSRAVELFAIEDDLFMLIEFDIGASTGLDLFHVDARSGELRRIFSGGTRSTDSGSFAIMGAGDAVIFNIPGVGLVASEPQLAIEAIVGE